jgi:hypothetical protein
MNHVQLVLAAFSYFGAMAGTAVVDRALDRYGVIAAPDSAVAAADERNDERAPD